MKLTSITEREDGSVEISVNRMTKRIRDAMGRWQSLTSYNGGETWVLDKGREKRRIERGDRLHPGITEAAIARHKVATEIHPAKTPEAQTVRFLPVHNGNSGKNRGKSHLRKKVEFRIKDVRKKAPHYHWCHGVQIVCCCDTSYLRRRCGGAHCLMEVNLLTALK